MIKIEGNVYLTFAIAVSLAIFFVAGQPPISGVLNGTGLHWIAHIATYGVLAACYAKGLPRVSVLLIVALTAVIGGLHELYEVGKYDIDFEFGDLFYDSLGALIGAALVRHLVLPRVARQG
jgi:hypothetical protein